MDTASLRRPPEEEWNLWKIGDLCSVVTNWSWKDISDESNKHKVREIPKMFVDKTDYLRSFLAPLFEEVRSEMLSNSLKRPDAYADSMMNLQGGKYTIFMAVNKDAKYEPQQRDIMLVSSPEKPGKSETINALVWVTKLRSRDGDDSKVLQVEVIGSPDMIDIFYEMREEMCTVNKQPRVRGPFEIRFLTNMVTYERISEALKMVLQSQLGIISSILGKNIHAASVCKQCETKDWYAGIQKDLDGFGLNESQNIAATSCISEAISCILAAKCCQKNSVRLIWGPPGTGC